jgi:D-alanyl-D-alanine carboxypeptidase
MMRRVEGDAAFEVRNEGRRRMALLIGVVLSLCAATVSARSAEGLEARVDSIAKRALSRPAAGISVAVALDGRTVVARGYGLANLPDSVPVTAGTVFHIASVSKNILAAVMLRLVDEGRLRLDDDVVKWVPEAPTAGHRVTVRQLLNHTSGIASFTSLPDAAENERRDLSQAQVLGLIRDKPFDFEPGTRWRYDNSAFYLAGMVVERVTGQTYGTYVREHVFEPLGMSSTSLCDARRVVAHLASGYEVDGEDLVNAAFVSWKLPSAAGAICATATDLLKWQTALETGHFLSPSSLALMRTPTTLLDGTKIDYGLGTRLGSLDGHRMLGHTGSGGGFRAVLESFPDDRLTIVVLINTEDDSPPPVAMAAEIARAALGLPETKNPLDRRVPRDELETLEGKYDSDEGTVETFARDGKLHFRILGKQREGVLLKQAEQVYAIDKATEVRFLVRKGRAKWATVYGSGLFLDAKYHVP